MDSKKIAKAEPGSISHGTMRPEDLIPSFFEALDEIAPDRASEIVRDEPLIPICHPLHIDWDAWPKRHPEAAVYLLEALFDALQEYAPEGHYFGAHPGDGSDYGFWLAEEFDVSHFCNEPEAAEGDGGGFWQ